MTVVSTADLLAILPELLVMTGGCLLLVLDPLTPQHRKDWLAFLGLATLGAAFVVGYWLKGSFTGTPRPAFSGLYVLDAYGTFWKLLLIGISALIILLAKAHLKLEEIDLPEFYALILLSLSGMMVMVSGTDLLVIYLGLELMSLCLYVMAGFKRYELRPLEAAAKYFILGSFSSGILLYGISLLFGRTGSTTLAGIREGIANLPAGDPILMLAMSLLVVGFGFKVAAVPFHMWTPDVYEGSPTSVTAYMAVASKAASFAAFVRVFLGALDGLKADWQLLLFMISLTGIPPTGGFIAKFYVFMAAVSAGMTGLAVVAVIFAAVSAYYYLRVVMVMYMRDPGEVAGMPGHGVRVVVSPATIAVLLVASAAVLILGVFPDTLVKAAQSAVFPLK